MTKDNQDWDDLPKLLRAIASGTQAQENRHDIIFHAAADEIVGLRSAYLLFLTANRRVDRLRSALEEAITIIHDAALQIDTDHLERVLKDDIPLLLTDPDEEA